MNTNNRLSESTVRKLRDIYDNTIEKFLRGELNFYDDKLFLNITFEKFLKWYSYSHSNNIKNY